MELSAVVGQSRQLTFQATADWTASCPADWVTLSPAKGSAGSATVSVTSAATNRTRTMRSSTLTITAGSSRKTVTVVQSGKFAVFKQKEYTVGPEGGMLALTFTTNLDDGDNLQIMYAQQAWIHWLDGARRLTRTEWEGTTRTLVVEPNTGSTGRVTPFVLAMPSDDGGDWVGLDTAYVYQQAVSSGYQSADFSADGKVTLLQKATRGRGISVVLMGDGFTDRDIADSTYHRVMAQAVENLFSEEPVRSLRDYFNVYMVAAVSADSGVGKERVTAMSMVPSNITSDIDFEEANVNKYVMKVEGIELDRTLAVVVVNSTARNGVTGLLVNQQTGKPRQYSVAACCMIDSLQSETFRQVLTHEAIGHGLAKLADEYGYESNGAPSASDQRMLKLYHQYRWLTNVDTADSEADVLWSPFIGDSRFANEQIGLYEGAYTYAMGVYRPTSESMMRHNESPFNAPSRKAIYDKVMELGEGRSVSTVDEFAAFDAEHKPVRWDYSTPATRSLAPWQRWRPAPPKFLRR